MKIAEFNAFKEAPPVCRSIISEDARDLNQCKCSKMSENLTISVYHVLVDGTVRGLSHKHLESLPHT